MESRLLSPGQFQELASLHTIPEAVEYLKKNTAYAETLESLEPTQLHRGNIEKLLTQSLYRDYTKLYRFCGQKQRKFMELRLKSYEIDLIDYCLRIVINHYKRPFDLHYKKEFFDRYSQLSIDRLITSRTTDELVDNLKGTEYYDPLKKLQDAQKVTLYDYDLEDLELYERDCGSQIDLLNMQWILRAKKYYNMKPADIYLLIIPIHYKLSTAQIKEMVEAAGIEELQTLVSQTRYGRQYHFQKNPDMEQMYSECLHHLYLIDRRRNPYSIAAVNTYLFLKEEEIKKLTTTLECIRYGLSPGETMTYVGGRTQ